MITNSLVIHNVIKCTFKEFSKYSLFWQCYSEKWQNLMSSTLYSAKNIRRRWLVQGPRTPAPALKKHAFVSNQHTPLSQVAARRAFLAKLTSPKKANRMWEAGLLWNQNYLFIGNVCMHSRVSNSSGSTLIYLQKKYPNKLVRIAPEICWFEDWFETKLISKTVKVPSSIAKMLI